MTYNTWMHNKIKR